MARPIEYVIQVSREEFAVLVEALLHPKPNAARDKMIEEAKRFSIPVRR